MAGWSVTIPRAPGSDDNFKHLASLSSPKSSMSLRPHVNLRFAVLIYGPRAVASPSRKGLCSCMWILFLLVIVVLDSMGVFAGGILLAVHSRRTASQQMITCPTQRPLGFLVDQYWTFLSYCVWITFNFQGALLGCGNSVVYTYFLCPRPYIIKTRFLTGSNVVFDTSSVAKHGIQYALTRTHPARSDMVAMCDNCWLLCVITVGCYVWYGCYAWCGKYLVARRLSSYGFPWNKSY